ncbi:MAG: HD domain-containing protein [Bacteroidales bacterium]|nr:HD domain-containing protein [Bacteroidales bacterium]
MKLSISNSRLVELKEWFSTYVKSFYNNDPEIQQNIVLKEEHTRRVCNEIVAIGSGLKLNHNELQLAEMIALLHDIGRFEQFSRYRTFADSKSENHAELGVKIIEKENILKPFNPEVQKVIMLSVKYHNLPSLPAQLTGPYLFYARLVRDADKLDIWKVVTDYYYRKDKKRNGAIELDLPDTPEFSNNIIQDLYSKKIINIKDVKTLNDFKLLQIGWIFDINFRPTFDCIKKRRYLEKIRGVLPESDTIDGILNDIRVFFF